MPSPKPSILCVDDEPNVLDAFKRQLHREFDVHVALDAREGIKTFAKKGPFPVVVSDFRMPVIDGISFLAKIRSLSPETVRILLTGNANLDNAADAVNRGAVFRFLTKPCQSDVLVATLKEALDFHEQQVRQKELLEQTFRGAIRALSEVLAMASPISFSRAQRAQATVAELCKRLGVTDRWEIEVACLLSQIGAVTLSQDILTKMHAGIDLEDEEIAEVVQMPKIAIQLLESIPRIEPVIEILENLYQDYKGSKSGRDPGPVGDDIPLGARMLRLALDLDDLEARGKSSAEIIEILRGRDKRYDPQLVDILEQIQASNELIRDVRELSFDALKVGMVLIEDIVSKTGTLLVARGQTITNSLLLRLSGFRCSVGIQEPIVVTIPKAEEENEDGDEAEAGGDAATSDGSPATETPAEESAGEPVAAG